MKDLFEKLRTYGPGWTLMFVVGENNSITMVLEYHDGSKNKPLTEKILLTTTPGIDIFTLVILHKMHNQILNQK